MHQERTSGGAQHSPPLHQRIALTPVKPADSLPTICDSDQRCAVAVLADDNAFLQLS